MIDNNELEMAAMELFKSGDIEKAQQLQEQFLKQLRDSRQDHCSCPKPCKHHGKCVECVVIHRGHGDHLPYCFRDMLNKRIDALSALGEHSYREDSKRSSD